MMQALREQCSRSIEDRLYISHDISLEYVQIVSELGAQFAPMANLINSIGLVKAFNCQYLSRLTAPEKTPEGVRIPEPTIVIFSTLRDVVKMLSNVGTPQQFRQHFYDHNPLPGAVWKTGTTSGSKRIATSGDGGLEDPAEPDPNDYSILMNPNDFMPEDYGPRELHADVASVQDLLEIVGRKYPKYVHAQRIDFKSPGNSSILVSNDTGQVRCLDLRRINGGMHYVSQNPIEGESIHFWSLRHLADAEFYMGINHFVGERPQKSVLTEAHAPRSVMSAEQEAEVDFVATLKNLLG